MSPHLTSRVQLQARLTEFETEQLVTGTQEDVSSKRTLNSTLFSFKPQQQHRSQLNLRTAKKTEKKEPTIEEPKEAVKEDVVLTPSLVNLIRMISVDGALVGKTKNPPVVDMNELAQLGTCSP